MEGNMGSSSISTDEARLISEKIQSDFNRKLESQGVSDEVLIEALKGGLDATTIKQFQNEGIVIKGDPVPNHEIRMKALDIALKLKSHYPAERKHIQVEGGLPMIPLSEDEQVELDAIKEVLRQRKGKHD